MHGTIEDHRRGHAFQTQRADEGRGFPMTVRHGCPAAFSARRTPIEPGHLGRRPCFIDEHQPLRLKIDLGVEPGLPPAKDIRPLLFGGVHRFFIGHVVAIQKAPDGTLRNLHAMRLVKIRGQLREGQVLGLTDQRHDLVSMSFELMRAIVAASSAWTNAASPSHLIDSLYRTRRRNPEKLRRRPSRHSTFNSRYQPFAQIHRKRFRHASWPPPPAHILNQINSDLGIPRDSLWLENALERSKHTSVDVKDLAVHETGSARSQEDAGTAQFLDLAPTC